MRKLQAELSFDDSSYKASRALEQMSVPTLDFTQRPPLPKRRGINAVCLECSRKFVARNSIPECPKCGGSDIDLA